jgi:hypothetical protein
MSKTAILLMVSSHRLDGSRAEPTEQTAVDASTVECEAAGIIPIRLSRGNMRKYLVPVALLGLLISACTASQSRTTTSSVPETASPTTSIVATTPTANAVPGPTAPRTVPPDIEVGEFEDWQGVDVAEAIGMLIRADGFITATAVEVGSCCENPVFRVSDIEEIAARDFWEPTGDLRSQGFQGLSGLVDPGDRVSMITSFEVTQLVFNSGGHIIHPVPQAIADGLEIIERREGTDNQLEALLAMWQRYDSDLWHTGPEEVGEVYLQGEPGYEDAACSATDLSGDVEDLLGDTASVDLPDAVAATRDRLLTAATDCDFAALLELAGPGLPRDEFWWGTITNEREFKVADRDGVVRMLVVALSGTKPVEATSGDGDVTYYEWPAASQVLDWTDIDHGELRIVSLLNGMSQQEFIDAWELFGGYGLFRVGIADDGTWLFALSGD